MPEGWRPCTIVPGALVRESQSHALREEVVGAVASAVAAAAKVTSAVMALETHKNSREVLEDPTKEAALETDNMSPTKTLQEVPDDQPKEELEHLLSAPSPAPSLASRLSEARRRRRRRRPSEARSEDGEEIPHGHAQPMPRRRRSKSHVRTAESGAEPPIAETPIGAAAAETSLPSPLAPEETAQDVMHEEALIEAVREVRVSGPDTGVKHNGRQAAPPAKTRPTE